MKQVAPSNSSVLSSFSKTFVNLLPPRFELEDSGFLRGKDQSVPLRLTCRASGQPLPELRWTLAHQVPHSNMS